MNLLHKTDHKA